MDMTWVLEVRGALGLLLGLIGLAAVIVCLTNPDRRAYSPHRRRSRDQQLAAQWAATRQLLDARPELRLVQVGKTYQRASTGTKAWVRRWGHSGPWTDTWFWETQWPPGTLLVVSPAVGWGPHNQNPAVLYIRREQIVHHLDSRAPKAAAAEQRRQQSSGEAV